MKRHMRTRLGPLSSRTMTPPLLRHGPNVVMARPCLHSSPATLHRLTDTSPPRGTCPGREGLARCARAHHDPAVLWTNGCILLMLWALGYVAEGAVGQWVHLLLGLALLHFVLALLKAGRHLPRTRGGWAGAPHARVEPPHR